LPPAAVFMLCNRQRNHGSTPLVQSRCTKEQPYARANKNLLWKILVTRNKLLVADSQTDYTGVLVSSATQASLRLFFVLTKTQIRGCVIGVLKTFTNPGWHGDPLNIPFSGGECGFSKTSQRTFTLTFKVCRQIKGSALQQLGIVKYGKIILICLYFSYQRPKT